MNSNLDGLVEAYGDRFDFAFDNQIILNWYPERIMRLCPPQMRLLELGIGHGYTTDRFSRHFACHVVIEGSASVIRQFYQRYPCCPATIVEVTFEEFETSQQFDVIVIGFVLEHVEKPRELLEKFKKFLAPGGRVFVAVPNGESLHRRIGHAAGLLKDMMSLGPGDHALGHLRMYSIETLGQDLESAGYKVVRREGVFLKPLTTAQLQSLTLSPEIITGMCEVAIGYPELSAALLFEASG